MKVIDIINIYSVMTALNMEKVAKEGKFEVLDVIDAVTPTVDAYNKQQDEAVKMLTDRGELSERLHKLQHNEIEVEIPKISKATFEGIMESNSTLTAGVCAMIRRSLVV